MFGNNLISKNNLLLSILILSIIAFTLSLNGVNSSDELISESSTKNITDIVTLNHANNQIDTYFDDLSLRNSLNQLKFIENNGQLSNSNVLYYLNTQTFQMRFLSNSIEFIQKIKSNSEISQYSLTFKDSNDIKPIGSQKIDQKNNYFLNENAFTNIPLFKEILYIDIYDKIDLRYYISESGLKYDFIVHPGAIPEQIKLKTSSNTNLVIHESNLLINDEFNNFNLLSDLNLFVYQNKFSNENRIDASFLVQNQEDNIFTYSIGPYDTSKDLIIDPVLVVNTSTYLGGSGEDIGLDLVLDSQKNIYLTGTTESTDFEVVDPINNTLNLDIDTFVMKINSTGNGILWSTYIGGNGSDIVTRIGLDGNNNVVIIGSTDSTNFPLIHSQNTNLNGSVDAFVTALSNNGQSLVLSSLIGGEKFEDALGLFIPATTTEYYITGITNSENFTTTSNAYNKTYGGYGEDDAFMLKISVSGTISYSSFIGWNETEQGIDISVSSTGIYLLGITYSNLSGIMNNGVSDIFIMKFTPDGTSLIYSKLIGGNDTDSATSLFVKDDEAYITGRTFSLDFPVTASAFDQIHNNKKAFVLKLSNTGSIAYSTLFGGTASNTYSNKILVDTHGQAAIAGSTFATDLPLLNEYETTSSGSLDGFITVFNSQGTDIVYSTYIGGEDLDDIYSFALGDNNEIYLTGDTSSLTFPINDAINSEIFYDNSDAFYTKLSLDYITPDLTLKSDFSYEENTIGNNLTFLASDNDPQAYYKIFKDDVEVTSGIISKDKVSYSVDGLEIGSYTFKVTVEDRTGNKITKMSIITVVIPIQSSSTTTASNTNGGIFDDPIIISMILIVGLGIISAFSASVIMKNRINMKTTKDKNLDQTEQKTDISEVSEKEPKE
jgi:hypothetical protein